MGWLARLFESTDARAERELHEAIGDKSASVIAINAFIERAPMSINSRLNREKATAVHRAVAARKPSIVGLLVKHGADINAKDARGWSPLEHAAFTADVDMTSLLLKLGANVREESDACGGNALTKLLLGGNWAMGKLANAPSGQLDESRRKEIAEGWEARAKAIITILVKNGSPMTGLISPYDLAKENGLTDIAELLRRSYGLDA